MVVETNEEWESINDYLKLSLIPNREALALCFPYVERDRSRHSSCAESAAIDESPSFHDVSHAPNLS